MVLLSKNYIERNIVFVYGCMEYLPFGQICHGQSFNCFKCQIWGGCEGNIAIYF